MQKKEELLSAFNKLKNALKENDVKTLDEMIYDDYKGYSLNGTVETKKEIINSFKPGGVILTEYSVEDIDFEISDNIGIISGKGFISGKFEEFNFKHNVLFTDIFKMCDTGWKYFKSQVTEIKLG